MIRLLIQIISAAAYLIMATVNAAPKSSNGSDIGLLIMGTIVEAKKKLSVALVKETASGKVKALKTGMQILDFNVVEITTRYMLVEKGNEMHLVYIDKFAGEFVAQPKAAPGLAGAALENFHEDGFERRQGNINMTAAYRDKLVNQDLGAVLMQAPAEAYMENGRVAGFKMSQIDEGSIYWKGGLQDNDVITEINGQKLDSVPRAIAILKALKQENAIEVQVLRNGSQQKISLHVN